VATFSHIDVRVRLEVLQLLQGGGRGLVMLLVRSGPALRHQILEQEATKVKRASELNIGIVSLDREGGEHGVEVLRAQVLTVPFVRKHAPKDLKRVEADLGAGLRN